MRTRRSIAAAVTIAIACAAALTCGCHNTAQGIKDDTRNAVQKTGQGVEKTGQKIEFNSNSALLSVVFFVPFVLFCGQTLLFRG